MTINLTDKPRIEIELSKTKRKFVLISSIFLCFSLLLAGCSFYSKDAYLEDFSKFITTIEQNYQSYTEDDWITKNQEYEEYADEEYDRFREKLTDEDQKLVGKLKAKYQTVVIKYNTEKMIDGVSDGLNQLEGAVNGVIEGINK